MRFSDSNNLFRPFILQSYIVPLRGAVKKKVSFYEWSEPQGYQAGADSGYNLETESA